MTNKLNEIQKEEILIKQKRLKTILDIEKLSTSAASGDVNIEDILSYANVEKKNLVLDIVNSLDIKDFDETFNDNGDIVKDSIEESVYHMLNIKSDISVVSSVSSEFVSALATYDIEDLLNYGIIHSYLKMINMIILCYDEIDISSCKSI